VTHGGIHWEVRQHMCDDEVTAVMLEVPTESGLLYGLVVFINPATIWASD